MSDEYVQKMSSYLEIEGKNFRIDSTGWRATKSPKTGFMLLVNPTGDVWEARLGPDRFEQYFTHAAAVRETQKAGKSLPSKNQWMAIIRRRMPEVVMLEHWQCVSKKTGTAQLGLDLSGFVQGTSINCV